MEIKPSVEFVSELLGEESDYNGVDPFKWTGTEWVFKSVQTKLAGLIRKLKGLVILKIGKPGCSFTLCAQKKFSQIPGFYPRKILDK